MLTIGMGDGTRLPLAGEGAREADEAELVTRRGGSSSSLDSSSSSSSSSSSLSTQTFFFAACPAPRPGRVSAASFAC
jgi:hypothetical protein